MGKYLDMAKKKMAEPKPAPKPTTPEVEAEKARRLLDAQGWCILEAAALGNEHIVLLRDGTLELPTRYRNLVAYSLCECDRLGGLASEHLRRVHEAKKIFGGRVITPPEVSE